MRNWGYLYFYLLCLENVMHYLVFSLCSFSFLLAAGIIGVTLEQLTLGLSVELCGLGFTETGLACEIAVLLTFMFDSTYYGCRFLVRNLNSIIALSEQVHFLQEPKKMIRYLDSRVVSVKGEKFTEIKKPEDESMKNTYINLKPARQYRFHWYLSY